MIIHSDDTGVKVLNEPGKEAKAKSNMWLYRTGGDSETPVAFYEYQPNRNGEHLGNFLKGWSGFCHTDGLAAYHSLKNVITVGCRAHVRRKFNDAFKITKASDSPAKIGLDYCNRLFELEREYADMTAEARYEARLKQSKPLAREFFAWAETVVIPPKVTVNRAIAYLLNQRE